jgi:hypothetical protein
MTITCHVSYPGRGGSEGVKGMAGGDRHRMHTHCPPAPPSALFPLTHVHALPSHATQCTLPTDARALRACDCRIWQEERYERWVRMVPH